VDLLLRGLGRLLEEDLDDDVLAHVVRPRVHPGEEREEEAEQEHPDEHGHRRGHRRRDVRADGAKRLAEEELGPRHQSVSVVYWPRRSSRITFPFSSAITRLRILSTISRSWVAMTTVVPVRLMR